jgi:uncharacterized protein YecE (DUF72 family)
MKFGKLPDIRWVNFTLPPDHPQTAATLSGHRSEAPPRVFVGSARWGEKDLVGKIYPPKTPPADYLTHYSRHFSTIELNTTHYRIPTPELVQQWGERTEPGFVFCPKVPQLISHQSDFGQSLRATDQFLAGLAAFGSRLGIPFLQLPPSFTPQRGKALFAYLADWPADVPLAVEFRHPDWFSRLRLFNRAFDLLEELGISVVITDTAGRRDVIHQRLTTPRVFIRFVGNRLHATDYLRIDSWVRRIQRWLAAGVQQVYFIVHQPEEHLCVDLAIYAVEQLNQHCGLSISPPRPINLGVQQSLF